MMNLEKWHSLGNDFLISKTLPSFQEISRLCDRNFGIGADQFIFIDGLNIRFFNSNGTEAEMCGNALKCVGEIVANEIKQKKFNLQTKKGIVEIELCNDGFVQINLGSELAFEEINKNEFFVNLGNPHYIKILDNIKEDFFESENITNFLKQEGKKKQKEFFDSNGINFSIVYFDKKNLLVRTFERGVGETLSCGSGSCASFLACYKSGIIKNSINVINRGSKKVLDFKESFHFIFYSYKKEILLKGKGTKVADIKIK